MYAINKKIILIMHVFTAEKYSPFNYSANNTALYAETQTSSVHNGKRREEISSCIHTIMFLQAVWTKKRAPAGTF